MPVTIDPPSPALPPGCDKKPIRPHITEDGKNWLWFFFYALTYTVLTRVSTATLGMPRVCMS